MTRPSPQVPLLCADHLTRGCVLVIALHPFLPFATTQPGSLAVALQRIGGREQLGDETV